MEAAVRLTNGSSAAKAPTRAGRKQTFTPHTKVLLPEAAVLATKSKPGTASEENSSSTTTTTTETTSAPKRRVRKNRKKPLCARLAAHIEVDPDHQLVLYGENGEVVNPEEYTSADGYTQCPWADCTYESKRIWALKEHINLTHTGVKQFGCRVEGCPATFFGSSELDNHMKRAHTEEASREFMPCTWPGCNALFKSKLGLRAHLQVHRGENLIACDWPGCNYAAKNKRQSENHTRKHTGDRPYGCDFPGCPAKFRTNDSLRHHKKSHSEYRPFRCDWPGCEANFKVRDLGGLEFYLVLTPLSSSCRQTAASPSTRRCTPARSSSSASTRPATLPPSGSTTSTCTSTRRTRTPSRTSAPGRAATPASSAMTSCRIT